MNYDNFENVGQLISSSKSASSFTNESPETFYARFRGEYAAQWNELDEFKFKNTCIGKFNFLEQIPEMKSLPDLTDYHIAMSQNGGPIAFLLKHDARRDNRKGDTKHLLFVFSSTGQLINKINVKQLIK